MNRLEAYFAREVPLVNRRLARLTEEIDPYVKPTVKHVLDAGGKRFRPLLTIMTARALGYAGEDVHTLACCLEFLHSATLLHDDILDGASLRRGRASAHAVFGATHTILAGDVLLALANRLVADYGRPDLTAILSEALLRTATGEIRELAHLRDTDMTLEAYMEVITGKTAYLIQAACQCGAVLAGAGDELCRDAALFGLNLGIAFQLVDDALDYASPSRVTGKPFGADLREGKVTLPLLLYLSDLEFSARRRLTDDFRSGQLSDEDLDALRETVVRAGCVERTRETAREFLEMARSGLSDFPSVPETDLLAMALDLTIARDK